MHQHQTDALTANLSSPGSPKNSKKKAKILQMEVETEEEAFKNVIENIETDRKKVNEVSYGVFYKNFEKELENIKKFVDKQKRMDVDKIQNIKEMFTKIGKDYRFSKRTQNMRNRSNVFERIWKQTVEKIVNSENSKFRKITSAEIQKLMKLCKNEQNIVNRANIVKNVIKILIQLSNFKPESNVTKHAKLQIL